MASVHMASLPKEIQLDIGRLLEQSDLAALSAVCRDLRDVAGTLLYDSITMRWTQQDYRPRIALLLRTVLERRELGHHIRSLELQGDTFFTFSGYMSGVRGVHNYGPCNQEFEKPEVLPGRADALAMGMVRAAVTSLGLPPGKTEPWLSEIQRGVADALVALIVSMLPNLCRLSLSNNWTDATRFLGLVFGASVSARLGAPHSMHGLATAAAAHPLPAFDPLESIYLGLQEHEEDTKTAENTLDMLALFYLPSIRTLSIKIDNPIHFSWPFPAPPNPTSLRCLKLSRIRETRLEPLLSAIPNLETLVYKWFYQPDVDQHVSHETVRLDTMAAAIARCSESLRALEIKAGTEPASQWGDYEPPDITLQGSLRELSRLHRLKHLAAPWPFIVGVDFPPPVGLICQILPPNIEGLLICSCLWDYTDYLGAALIILSTIESELENGAISHLSRLTTIELPNHVDGNWFREGWRDDAAQLALRFNLSITFLADFSGPCYDNDQMMIQ